MKKLSALLLALCLLLSLCACTAEKDTPKPTDPPQAPVADSALALLETVWNAYPEADKFAVVGGDFSEENMTQDAPGKYSVDDAAALESTFALPAAQAAQIDDAASLVHMMNANTFTCGAFHLKSSGERSTFADALKTAVLGRQWMCGFPETLLIIAAGDYVVSVFGNDELIQTFKAQFTAAYASAEVLTEEAITF